jgi:hypothetical protein
VFVITSTGFHFTDRQNKGSFTLAKFAAKIYTTTGAVEQPVLPWVV